jgi:hypothetical protein
MTCRQRAVIPQTPKASWLFCVKSAIELLKALKVRFGSVLATTAPFCVSARVKNWPLPLTFQSPADTSDLTGISPNLSATGLWPAA